jgi:hypothetical protein
MPPVAVSGRRPRWSARFRWATLAMAAVAATVGSTVYLLSPDNDVAPVQALRQLDMFYLDEPAPRLDTLGVEPGRPALILFCEPRCARPQVTGAQVVQSIDASLAAQYALQTADGRVGPGYAVVNADGRLRYRTFDPAPAEHDVEIQILIDALEDPQ